MKTGNKSVTKKKGVKKLRQKENSSDRPIKDLRKVNKIDTDFHHVHPFKEQ